jgi:predicted transport protein
VCVKKGLEDQPTGNASIILKLHIQNKFNNRETEKNINSDVKNILMG